MHAEYRAFVVFFNSKTKETGGGGDTKVLFAVRLEDQKGSCCRDMADVIFISEDPLHP